MMDTGMLAVICIAGMFILMMLGIPLPWALGFVSIVGITFGMGWHGLMKVGWTPFPILHNMQWTPLPLFVLMGSVMTETGIGTDVFKAASNWLSRIPGGLIIASIWAEAVMAAAIGTSTATIVAVGNTAIPQMVKYGYKRGFSAAALVAGGVLGPLIPPSAMMIVYAIYSSQSLGKLLIAGIIPGIILAIMLSLCAAIICIKDPDSAPRPAAVKWREKFYSVRKIWPVVIVMLSILGGIYMGVVTPTEAAGFGVVVILLLGIVFFRLRIPGLNKAVRETALINAMMMLVIIVATIFSFVVGSAGIGKQLIKAVVSASLSPWVVIIIINFVLLLLGSIMDGITIMVVSLPLLIPLIEGLGFNMIWFGVVFVVNMELGLITPPFAMNLFMVKTMFGIPAPEIIRGVMPFIVVLVIFLILLIAFPQVSLWLPNQMLR
jgi:C4-dicarboxylate transporter, DctM subunit